MAQGLEDSDTCSIHFYLIANRWSSPFIRLYTPKCKDVRETDTIENCGLNDYTFGEIVHNKYNVFETNALSAAQCMISCENHKNCTFSSWKEDEGKCKILIGLRQGHREIDNPLYFCNKKGSIINEREVVCKSVSQVIHD